MGGSAYVWLNRDSVAENAIKGELARLGIPVESLTVTGISPRSMTLADLKLGEGGALHVATATLNFK